MKQNEILELFRQTGALLHGHFILRSGLHSREFFQCALLLRDTKVAERVCGALADQLRSTEFDTVISPALGGILVGQEVARQLGKPHIFTEKNDTGALVLRRGFTIQPGERFAVIEDVVTRGGRLMETGRSSNNMAESWSPPHPWSTARADNSPPWIFPSMASSS